LESLALVEVLIDHLIPEQHELEGGDQDHVRGQRSARVLTRPRATNCLEESHWDFVVGQTPPATDRILRLFRSTGVNPHPTEVQVRGRRCPTIRAGR
jgi:hypothetical protein